MDLRRTELKIAALLATVALAGPGCSSVGNVFATQSGEKEVSKPISNPFDGYAASKDRDSSQNMVFRTKKGDRSVEVELPRSSDSMSEFVIPMAPAFKEQGRGGPGGETNYMERKSSISDREIAGTFPNNTLEDEGKRRDVEQGLGLMAADNTVPDRDSSYLAGVDQVKQLYRTGRFEAALLESDEMVRQYPTDPKLYEMRGTLFERIGRADLAVRSWNQALRLNPQNATLRKFIERKQARIPASSAPPGGSP